MDAEDLEVVDKTDSIDPQILVNALTTVAHFKTMRITSYYKKNHCTSSHIVVALTNS